MNKVEVFKAADFKDCGPAVHPGGVDKTKIADIANRILAERGVRMYAHLGPSARHDGTWMSEAYKDADSTHHALLVAVQPIAKDTAESLLQELVNIGAASYTCDSAKDVLKRARKVLEQKWVNGIYYLRD